MTKRRPFDIFRALDQVRCPVCDDGGSNLRVTAKPLGLFSTYACDECADMVRAIVTRAYPGAPVDIHPLPRRQW